MRRGRRRRKTEASLMQPFQKLKKCSGSERSRRSVTKSRDEGLAKSADQSGNTTPRYPARVTDGGKWGWHPEQKRCNSILHIGVSMHGA